MNAPNWRANTEMEPEIKEHDVVTLLVDLPEQGLRCGDVGTAVYVFEANEHHPAGYINVGSSDSANKTRAELQSNTG